MKKEIRMLLSTLVVKVHSEHLARLEAIDNEDYSPVVRKVSELFKAEYGHEPTSEYLDSGIEGLKQYYTVALLDPQNAHAVSAKIDLFWHAHILHSKQYSDFCDKVVGRYMHHVPLDKDNPEAVENIAVLYDYTVEILPKLFKEVNLENWPLRNDVNYKLICAHFGTTKYYAAVDAFAIFPPDERGVLLPL